jgi:alpha-tubulin suppressor-like RCC1 family protein
MAACVAGEPTSSVSWGTARLAEARQSPAPCKTSVEVVGLAAGGFHNCAILSDRTVQCWGRNQDGQLGNGHTTRPMLARRMVGLGSRRHA